MFNAYVSFERELAGSSGSHCRAPRFYTQTPTSPSDQGTLIGEAWCERSILNRAAMTMHLTLQWQRRPLADLFQSKQRSHGARSWTFASSKQPVCQPLSPAEERLDDALSENN